MGDGLKRVARQYGLITKNQQGEVVLRVKPQRVQLARFDDLRIGVKLQRRVAGGEIERAECCGTMLMGSATITYGGAGRKRKVQAEGCNKAGLMISGTLTWVTAAEFNAGGWQIVSSR